MKHFFFSILAAAGLSLFFMLPGFAAPLPSQADGGELPIQINADNVEYFHEDQKAVGTGNVWIRYEDVELTADKITLYMAAKTAVAEGHVTLKQKGNTFTGARAEYNFQNKSGNVSGMHATIEPSLYGKAERIERMPDGHYRATNSYLTTCCGDNPFYKVEARGVDIYPGKKVVMRNALLSIKGVPILFIPVYVQPLMHKDRFPIQLAPGKNTEWGPFLLSKWRYQLVDRSDISSRGNVLLDYRVKRGFGAGVQNFYKGERVGRGAARIYYADDKDAPSDINSNRSRLQWRHQSKLANSTSLTMEMNKLSDAAVIKDFFFREEYERDVFPDNYVSVITAKPEYTLSILERHRLNDFYTVVNRDPEIRLDTHNRQFSGTPFYLREEYQFSVLQKEFAESEMTQDATRFDTNHTLSYAGRVSDISVTPRVGTRQTYYSRDLDEGSGFVRGTFDPGIDVSTHFYKTYDVAVHSWGLDYNQLRHIFVPTASYNYRPNPTVLNTELQQFDAIDAIDKQNFVRVAFENKLQTKEHSGDGVLMAREIARVIPFFDYDFDTSHLENVGYDVELRPYSWIGIESDATYNTRTGKIDTLNADLYLSRSDKFSLSVGQRYVIDESSQTTVETRWKISPDLSVKIYDRYEFEEGESKEFEATLSKTFECVIVDFTYNHRVGDSFFFVFHLKGYPKASFGLSQSYNRPKAETGPVR